MEASPAQLLQHFEAVLWLLVSEYVHKLSEKLNCQFLQIIV